MSQYIRHFTTPLLLCTALTLGACKSGDSSADTSLAQDTALSRDLELAGQGDTAQPQLADVPAGGAAQPSGSTSGSGARRTTPARTGSSTGSTTRPPTRTTTPSGNTVSRAPSGSENLGSLPAGTTLRLASNERVCTNNRKVGDSFTARLTEPVTANGVTIPAGATAVVRITALQQSDNVNEPVVMKFDVSSIRYDGRSYPITAEVTQASVEKVRSSSKSSDAKKVVGGAVVGAIAGQILGKDTKSTVIGAATGAAAGTAVAMATGNYEGCIPEGGTIAIRLTAPARVAAD